MQNPQLLFSVLAGIAVAALLLYAVTIYNSLVAVRREVDRAWANIDVLLKQRFDELPKLVAVCRAYMKYEQETLERVLNARNSFARARSPVEKVGASGASAGLLGHLFALAEQYPDLKADEQFRHLRERISLLESQIADRRETYNDVVNAHNVRIATLPDMLLAVPLGYRPMPLFEAEDFERSSGRIEFGPETGAGGDQR